MSFILECLLSVGFVAGFVWVINRVPANADAAYAAAYAADAATDAADGYASFAADAFIYKMCDKLIELIKNKA